MVTGRRYHANRIAAGWIRGRIFRGPPSGGAVIADDSSIEPRQDIIPVGARITTPSPADSDENDTRFSVRAQSA